MRHAVHMPLIIGAVLMLSGCASTNMMSKVEEMEPSRNLDPAPRPDPPAAGTVWHGIGGETGNVPTRWELISVNEDKYIFRDSSGCTWTLTSAYDDSYLFTNSIQWENCGSTDGNRRIKGMEGGLWPLEVGKTVKYKALGHSGGTWGASWQCEVTDEVGIKVEAGKFDTYKVVCESPWKREVHYYSPELESNVRYLRKPTNTGSSVSRADWQLKRIEHPEAG